MYRKIVAIIVLLLLELVSVLSFDFLIERVGPVSTAMCTMVSPLIIFLILLTIKDNRS